jgi:2-haloacid dehalogenase
LFADSISLQNMNRAAFHFDSFEWLTFDCYGTLIDWEAGIISVLAPLLATHKICLDDQKLLELYSQIEAELESDAREYICYRDVLSQVVVGLGERLGFIANRTDVQSLPGSVSLWKPFPDTVAALSRFKQRYKLGIISNTDDDLFAASAQHLKVPFDEIVTAQQARSYKPALNNFQFAIQRIGVPKSKVLHVAQSIYHDVVPARTLGLASVWVNRRKGMSGPGATKAAVGRPDLEVEDLKTLAEMAC